MPRKKKAPMKSGSSEELPPDKLKDTDWAIIKHVALYHFTIREAIQGLFFSSFGKSSASHAQNALEALTRHGYLNNGYKATEKTNPSSNKAASLTDAKDSTYKIGEHEYYILGGRCAKLRQFGFSFPKERLQPPSGPQSFYTHLAAFWYCLFDEKRRYRLELEELYELWKDVLPEGRRIPHQPAYCISNDADSPVVYCLYPTRRKKSSQIVEGVFNKLEEAAERMALQSWIEAGRYGYAILVPSEDKKHDVQSDLKKLRKQYPSLSKAPITVHYAPTPSQLSKALKEILADKDWSPAAEPIPSEPVGVRKDQSEPDTTKVETPTHLHFGSIDVGLD